MMVLFQKYTSDYTSTEPMGINHELIKSVTWRRFEHNTSKLVKHPDMPEGSYVVIDTHDNQTYPSATHLYDIARQINNDVPINISAPPPEISYNLPYSMKQSLNMVTEQYLKNRSKYSLEHDIKEHYCKATGYSRTFLLAAYCYIYRATFADKENCTLYKRSGIGLDIGV